MELDIGKHCEFCRQLDYCPFVCNLCKKDFCLEHRTPDGHECDKREKPKPIPIQPPKLTEKCNRCKKPIPKSALYICHKCNERHCPKHRIPEDHECSWLAKLKEDVAKSGKLKP